MNKKLLKAVLLIPIIAVGQVIAQTGFTPGAGATVTYAPNVSDTIYDPGGPGGNDVDGSPGNYPNCDCITTITLTNVTEFRFDYFNVFATFDWVKIYDAATATGTPIFDNQSTGEQLKSDIVASLGNAVFSGASGDMTIEFRASGVINRGGFAATITRLNTAPTCDPVVDIASSNVTSTDADISWTAQGTESSWNIEYGPAGFSTGSGTVINTSNNPHTLTGLTPDTDYDYYVQADCGSGDLSAYVGSGSFVTLPTCPAPSALNFTDIGADSVVISWTENGSSVDWTFEYGPTGFTQGSGSIVNTTDNPDTLTGLTSSTEYDVYLWSDCGGGDLSDTITGSFTTQATCPVPSALNFADIGIDSVVISWTENGSSMDWTYEYGPTGFTQGSGTIVNTSDNPDTLTGLTSNTGYDVYLWSDCGGGDLSDTITGSFVTECGVIDALDLCESFDSNSSSQSCWSVLDENADGDEWNMDYTSNPNSGDESAMMYTDFNSGNNDDWLISPKINLTANEVMNFFYRVQSDFEPNEFEVLLSTTGQNPADFEDTLMYLASYDNETYMDTTVDLSAYSGNVYISFHVPSGGLDGWRLYIDDVCFDVCVPEPGQDGYREVCRADGTADLNDVITKGEENGEWIFPGNQQLVVDDTLFSVSNLPADEYEVLYVVEGGCETDTTIATINVFAPSSAGEDGSVEVCLNEPVNLFQGLNGNVDLGGDWYDSGNNMLSSSQIAAPASGGNYNYNYVTSNGVCPADTSLVDLIVDGDCDYLSLATEAMNEISIYPNPATEEVNIVNPANSEALKVEILDVNGRVVAVDDDALENTTEGTVAIDHLETGIYTIRIYNEFGQKTFKLVKQ